MKADTDVAFKRDAWMKMKVWVVVLAAGLASLPAAAEESGRRAGFQLLREEMGARATAMGGAFTAIPDDQSALAWNPATAASLTRKDFIVSHQTGLADVRQSYAGWAYGNGRRGVGMSFGIHNAGGIDARSGPTAEPAGSFNLFELNATFTYAQRLFGHVFGGFTVHMLHEDLASDRASGFAVDFGLLFNPGVTGLTLGASFRNLGRMDALVTERVPLPRTFRAGAAYAADRFTVSADGRFPEFGNAGVNVGVEARPAPGFAVRAGYRTGHDTRDMSFGFGLVRRNWRIDYAFVPQDLDLGGAHRISLGIR